ncbi:aminopeptidase P family protein [Halorarum halophilum]|uniref:Aminopeptidase P family protein n=1 Tax=Halorarum halophilum TaxID=2743090 RepID=A0A7D5K715_9EURY|nr:Xaa-Pro peptidase family protein [Halobaculum halophilum]QLG27074.1 aminopeptidase P family protein [Halobaculum halophilum]
MDPDLSQLDSLLAETGADAYCIDADSADSNQLYLSGFDAPDPFFTAYTGDSLAVLVSGLEYGRASKESRADTVARLAEYDHYERVDEYGEAEGTARTYATFLADLDAESVLVPDRFPVGVADGLRDRGVDVGVDHDDVVEMVRATKTPEEVDHVKRAQDANEAAMGAAEELIRAADVDADGTLVVEGDPLTSERVQEEIEVTLLRHGCSLDETIVACGADAADPHDRGSGPLSANETIIIDIFPRGKASKYHADMTRTFVKGEASEEVRRRFEVTHRALEAAFDALEPGATGADVHDAVCDLYEEEGYETLRSDSTTETGFIHSTGHGVGLDVHEAPGLNPRGGELKPGHVVTIEPGLYDPEVGGVRIEDIAVVTEDGYENFTDYPVELELE